MIDEMSKEEFLSHFKHGSYGIDVQNKNDILNYTIGLNVEPINQLYAFPIPRNDGSFYDTFMAVASDLKGSDKAVYLSLLMSEKQILQILNNKHLFDDNMIKSAYYLLSVYHDLQKIEV